MIENLTRVNKYKIDDESNCVFSLIKDHLTQTKKTTEELLGKQCKKNNTKFKRNDSELQKHGLVLEYNSIQFISNACDFLESKSH